MLYVRLLNFRWAQVVEFSFLAQTCQMFREFTGLHLNFCWWSVVTVLHWKELSTSTWLMVNSVWVRHLHNFLKCQWLHTVCLSSFKKTLDDFPNDSPSVRIWTLMAMFKPGSFICDKLFFLYLWSLNDLVYTKEEKVWFLKTIFSKPLTETAQQRRMNEQPPLHNFS